MNDYEDIMERINDVQYATNIAAEVVAHYTRFTRKQAAVRIRALLNRMIDEFDPKVVENDNAQG